MSETEQAASPPDQTSDKRLLQQRMFLSQLEPRTSPPQPEHPITVLVSSAARNKLEQAKVFLDQSPPTRGSIWPGEDDQAEATQATKAQFNARYHLPTDIRFAQTLYNVKGGNDPFVKSNKVYQLSYCTFDEFLSKQDTTLVMFYDHSMKRNKGVAEVSKQNFIKAAETATRPRTSYATVDCSKNIRLCTDEINHTFPYFKLYSRGVHIGSHANTISASSKLMKDIVEMSPIADV